MFNLFVGDVIHFSKALPGTRYDFWLFYSNSSIGGNNLVIHNSPQTPDNVIAPGVNSGEKIINGASFLPTHSQWLLTWTASITTGTKQIK